METIGTADLPIQVTTRVGKMCPTGDKTYKAVETGPDTGIFTAQVELTGFDHTLSSMDGPYSAAATSCGTGNTDGKIKTSTQTDGVSVSYEYIDNVVVVASASVSWNIGEALLDSTTISIGDPATFTVVDPDENVDSAIIDAFTVGVYSNSDQGGLTLAMTETGVDTGIFTGVFITTTDITGSKLHVSDGDTVTAEYNDVTLPEPYTQSDSLTIDSTLTVGTVVPPLERAPAANPRVVDAFGSSVAEVSVDQQVQIATDVSNGQGFDQAFAYLVQMRDSYNVPVSLAWITGSLTAGQSMSPALSWTPDRGGTFTATAFVWESVDNPIPLSAPVSTTFDVVEDWEFSITEPSSDYCGEGTVLTEGVCHIPSPDSVGVDAHVYDYGNEITISGNFANYDGMSHITILVFGPDNNIKTINQIVPDSSGSFSTEEIAAGKFSLSGTYTVKAYLGDNVLQTTFLFSGTPVAEPEPEAEQTEVIEEEPEMVPEITSFTTYTDPQDRFTINVPSGWERTEYFDFDGDAAWAPNDDDDAPGKLGVIYYKDKATAYSSTDSANLEAYLAIEQETCDILTFENDDAICYDNEVFESAIGPFSDHVDQTRPMYMSAQSWTIEYPDGSTQEKSGITIDIIDGADVWTIYMWVDHISGAPYIDGLTESLTSFLVSCSGPGTVLVNGVCELVPDESIQEITSFTTYTDPQGMFTIDVPSGWIDGDGTIPDIVGIDHTYYGDTGEILLIDTNSFDSWNGKIFISFHPNWGAVLSAYSDSANLTRFQDDLRDSCQSSSSDPHYYCYNHQTLVSSIGPFSGATDQTRTMYQLKGTYNVIYDPAEYPNRGSAVHEKLFIATQIIDGVDVWEIIVFVDNGYADAYVEALTQSSLSFMAASEPSMLVGTYEDSYNYGEEIEVYGMVGNYVGGDVTITVKESNGNILAINQIDPYSSGHFSATITGNFLPGTYTITTNYQGTTADISFELVGATLSNVTVQNAQGSSTPGCEETNECFLPSTVTIVEGGQVTWQNSDTAAHTATSGHSFGPDGLWDSSLIMPGGSFSVTLNTSGTYDYYCMVHPWMQGTVVVGDGVGPETEAEPVCGSGIVIDGVCQIEIASQPELDVYVGQSEYNVGDEITVTVGLINTESNEMIIVDVLDPAGNPVVTRAATVSPGDSESIEFRISNNFLTGNYKVVASSTIDGNTITDITFFKLKSLYNQFQISSVEVTDQQGNPSTLSKGTLGYIKVSLTSDANITALVTVNLFDADLLTLGVGSVRSTISEGETEIILSFLIPNDAASGDAEIFVNGFTDWISSGGIPLTGEFSTTGEIS